MNLTATNLSKMYSQRGSGVYAVRNVNATFESNKLTAIFGESGSGKSTLLSLLAGLAEPTRGTVSIDGEIFSHHDDIWRSLVRNQRIGYIPQGIAMLSHLTVLQNVVLPRTIVDNKLQKLTKSAASPNLRAMELLEKLGVSDLAGEYPQNISGGELRRVAVARALINEPEFLFADEPTSNLDGRNSELIFEILRKEAEKGAAVILITHDESVKSIADDLRWMKNGELIYDNSLSL